MNYFLIRQIFQFMYRRIWFSQRKRGLDQIVCSFVEKKV